MYTISSDFICSDGGGGASYQNMKGWKKTRYFWFKYNFLEVLHWLQAAYS